MIIDFRTYFLKHRQELDDEEVPSKLWDKVADQLDDHDLENLISNNLEVFSEQEPSRQLWNKIDNQLSNVAKSSKPKITKVVPITYLWKMAAMFTLILMATVWLLFKNQENNSSLAENETSLEAIDTELQEAEQYYESIINLKKAELVSFDLNALGLDSDFTEDIATLDAAYSEIKKEILSGNTNELLIKAMIDNLQLRMEILNSQLRILKQLQQNNKQDEHNTIQI